MAAVFAGRKKGPHATADAEICLRYLDLQFLKSGRGKTKVWASSFHHCIHLIVEVSQTWKFHLG